MRLDPVATAPGTETFGARGEIRTLRKLILSQPPLPIGLHAREGDLECGGKRSATPLWIWSLCIV